MLAGMLLLLPAAGLHAATRQATRSELRALQARIAAMSAQGSRDARERERLTTQLRAAELSLGAARGELALTNRALADHGAQRAALAAQRVEQARRLEATRAALAADVRAAYLLGRQGPLELLLNQHDPLASGRLLAYYGYFSRAGAERIEHITQQVQQLDALDAALAQQQISLSQLERSQQEQLQRLAAARRQRQQVLVSLTARAQTRAQRLAQLQSQQADLERLLRRLGRTAVRPGEPADLTTIFGRLRGELAWPVTGRLQAQFGQERASGVPWDGLLIGTDRGTPVHAVSAGRVVYADWLPGLGLLVIIDHGGGYLSLYGHNDRLFKAAGAPVSAGEVIAAAGDTGGRAQPQLYFEIRRAGKPIDPLPWFRTRSPTP